jgi:hypothetical protein
MSNIDRLAAQIESMDVPQLDVSAVRARGLKSAASKRRHIFAAVLAAIMVPMLAAAATYYLPVQIVPRGNGTAQIYAKHVEAIWRPSARTLADIARKAPYRIVWPSDLPARTHLRSTMVMNSEVVLLTYACATPGTSHFIIAPSDAAFTPEIMKQWPAGAVRVSVRRARQKYEWTAGEERVRLDTDCITPHQVAAIRSAMIAAGAAQHRP